MVTIFGKSWLLHVTEVLGATPAENLDMIADSIAFVADRGREAIYDAEHFFDGYKADRDYALPDPARRAPGRRPDPRPVRHQRRHADRRADADHRRRARDARGRPDAPAVTWGIHTHNDAELAVANSMAAVAAGIRHVQATINGYGERAGNANMVSILANLALKTPHDLVPAGGGQLSGLTELSRSIAEIANVTPERLPALRRALGVRPQGRCPRRRRGQGRTELPAHRPGVGRQRRAARRVRAGRASEHLDPGRAARPRARGRRRSARAVQPDQAARGGRSRLRGRRGELRAAHPPPRGRLRGPLPDRRLHLPGRAARRSRAAAPRRPSRSRSMARSCTPRATATVRSTRSTPRCARRCERSTRGSTRSAWSTTRSASSTASRRPRLGRA